MQLVGVYYNDVHEKFNIFDHPSITRQHISYTYNTLASPLTIDPLLWTSLMDNST